MMSPTRPRWTPSGYVFAGQGSRTADTRLVAAAPTMIWVGECGLQTARTAAHQAQNTTEDCTHLDHDVCLLVSHGCCCFCREGLARECTGGALGWVCVESVKGGDWGVGRANAPQRGACGIVWGHTAQCDATRPYVCMATSTASDAGRQWEQSTPAGPWLRSNSLPACLRRWRSRSPRVCVGGGGRG